MKKILFILFYLLGVSIAFSQVLLEGTFKPECDACKITFNKDMTFNANINVCDGYQDISGTYKIENNNILLSTKDFDFFIAFTMDENKEQITQTRINKFGCDNCDEGTPWILLPTRK